MAGHGYIRLEIAGNSKRWLEMAGNCWNGWKWLKLLEMARHGLKRLEMAFLPLFPVFPVSSQLFPFFSCFFPFLPISSRCFPLLPNSPSLNMDFFCFRVKPIAWSIYFETLRIVLCVHRCILLCGPHAF